MEEKILQIKKEALQEIEQIKSQKELDEIRNKYLSRASELNNLKKGLKDVAPELRPKIGALTNEISKEIEALVNKKAEEFYQIELNKKLEAEKIDVTLPSTYEPFGHIHPLTKTTNEIVEIFEMLGFSLIKNEYSPEVEVVRVSGNNAGMKFINLDKSTANKILYMNMFMADDKTLQTSSR